MEKYITTESYECDVCKDRFSRIPGALEKIILKSLWTEQNAKSPREGSSELIASDNSIITELTLEGEIGLITLTKEHLRETACEKCPATCWGQKSICRVHDLHIGKVESCPEWDKYLIDNQGLKEKNGQLAFINLEPVLEVVQKVEEEIKDYHWMVKEVDRLRKEIHNAIISNPSIQQKLVATYGDAAGMPSGKGLRLSSLTIPEERYEKQIERLKNLEDKVRQINDFASSLGNSKHRTVLECMMDGMRINSIARHVGVSRQRLNEIKRDIVNRLAREMYSDELFGS